MTKFLLKRHQWYEIDCFLIVVVVVSVVVVVVVVVVFILVFNVLVF